MEILFRKTLNDPSDNFVTIRRVESNEGIKTFISLGSFSNRQSIRSYELSESEIKDFADIFNKLINCPGFLLSRNPKIELSGEVELID